ncbi:MAG: hypothetical protein BM564_04005 [Bacteroidetes bacterium MedPE-SWsnd-G2]|nr:MAG: hypothetical protein BM564_04005 [Bacteroidetes bacterium MedPE-SWsnd-G2]
MEVVKEKSWFQRNWMWAVPGCGCLVFIAVIVFGAGAIFLGVKNEIIDSGPYDYALTLAQNDANVIEALGNDIEEDGMFKGNISYKNSSGSVDIQIPIKGSIGYGTIYVKGFKDDGDWEYEELYVLIKDSQLEINLLEKSLEVI